MSRICDAASWTFARVVILADKGYADDEIAFVMRAHAVDRRYRKLYGDFQDKHTGRQRIKEILSRVETPTTRLEKGR